MEDEDEIDMVNLPVQESTIGDGDIILFDIFEFCESVNAHGAMNRDGNLFVLNRETLKWVNVESLIKAGKLSAVKKD